MLVAVAVVVSELVGASVGGSVVSLASLKNSEGLALRVHVPK